MSEWKSTGDVPATRAQPCRCSTPPSPNASPGSDAHRSSESEISLKRKASRLFEKMQELAVSQGHPGAWGETAPQAALWGSYLPGTMSQHARTMAVCS